MSIKKATEKYLFIQASVIELDIYFYFPSFKE